MKQQLTNKLLSYLLTDESKYYAVQSMVTDDIFESSLDRSIFNAYKKQLLDGKKLDTVEIADGTTDPDIALRRIGNLIYEVDYSTDFASLVHGIFKSIKQDKLIKLIDDLPKVITENYNDPDKTLSYLSEFINHFNDNNDRVIKSMNENVDDVIKIVEHNFKDGGLTGIPTGFKQLNRLTNGLQGGDLIIVAGETSQGKTSFALNVASYASDYKNIYFFTMEMMPSQLTARLLAMDTGFNSNYILTGRMTKQEIETLSTESIGVRGKSILIDEKENNIDHIISNIRMMKTTNGIDMVVIDYLQLVHTTDHGNKEQRTADITRRLKNLAKELNMPIILISQLSRDRDKPFPRLSRLRDSGQIEEAADMVIFIYRPSFYGIEVFDNGDTTDGKAMIIVAKGRNTGTGSFKLGFNESLTKFTDDE